METDQNNETEREKEIWDSINLALRGVRTMFFQAKMRGGGKAKERLDACDTIIAALTALRESNRLKP